MVSRTPWLHFTREKDPAHILQEPGWASGPIWTGGKSRLHRDFFLNIYCTFNHIYRNLTSLLPRVLVVRFPYHVIQHSHFHSLTPAVCGFPFPTPCPILTTVCSFLGFSHRERVLCRVSTDSFLPATYGWPPGMTSISRDARSQYSRAVIGVFAAAIGT